MHIASKTFAVIVSLAVIIVSFSLLVPNLQAAGTVVVSGDTAAGYNEPGWLFNRDASTATLFEFNEDEASIGDGSLYVLPIDGGSPSDKFIAEHFLLTPLADVESVSYDFLVGSGGDVSDENEFYMNVYANFGESDPEKFYDCRYSIVPTSGSTATFTTITFDPTQSYPVTTRGGSSASPYTCPSVPADMDTLSSGSTVRMFALNVGDTSANDAGLDGYYDNVVVETTTETTTYDFEPETAAISGYKFEDVNNNGGFDDNEPQLEGWTIELYENDEFLEATMTNASGEYSFTNLTVGENYVVCEVQQPGWTQTFPDDCHFFEPLGGDEEHINFGNHFAVVPATIAGLKFSDLNNNGDFDDNEPHLEGWTIQLYDEEEELLATTTTDASGEYEFTGLLTGETYTVCEVQQSGWTQTTPTGNGCYVYDPLAGDVTDAFFGNYLEVVPATISGQKWDDRNYTGAIEDGLGDPDDDVTISGWGIELYQDETLIATTTTDSNGDYAFEDLTTGETYTVCETPQVGWTQVLPTATTTPHFDDGCYTFDPLTGDEDALFANQEDQETELTVSNWNDTNGDGIQDESTGLIRKHISRLYDAEWNLKDEGNTWNPPTPVVFSEAVPGDYVCPQVKNHWVQTYPNASTSHAVINESAALDEGTYCHQITDPAQTDLAFGSYHHALIEARAWHDLNQNQSIQTGDEPPLNGWTIRLYEIGDGNVWTFLSEGVTENYGIYRFQDIEPGTYATCEVLQDGWVPTRPVGALADEIINNSSALDEGEYCNVVTFEYHGGYFRSRFGTLEE